MHAFGREQGGPWPFSVPTRVVDSLSATSPGKFGRSLEVWLSRTVIEKKKLARAQSACEINIRRQASRTLPTFTHHMLKFKQSDILNEKINARRSCSLCRAALSCPGWVRQSC